MQNRTKNTATPLLLHICPSYTLVTHTQTHTHTLRCNHRECWECSAEVWDFYMLLPAINHKILSGDWTADSVGITHRPLLFQSIMSSVPQKAERLPNDIGSLSSHSVTDYVGFGGETRFVWQHFCAGYVLVGEIFYICCHDVVHSMSQYEISHRLMQLLMSCGQFHRLAE